MKFLIILVFILGGVANCYSQTDTVQVKEAPKELQYLLKEIQSQANQIKKDADIEIDGLLVNNTKTKNGNDFYELFYRDWVAPSDARDYSLFITEKPYRLTTTMIEIKINETVVFQSFLQPRIDIIEGTAQQAIAQTQIYLKNYEQIIKQLGGDDLSGSGIF